MNYFSEHKKAFIAGIIGILAAALIICVFVLAPKRHQNSENSNAVQSQDSGENIKTDENKTGGTDKNTDKTDGAKTAESPLKEGESLEKLVDDFNTLPDGEEKEKVRKRLEEILAEAEKQSPANSVNQEGNNGKDQ